jgi:hypothetical protein
MGPPGPNSPIYNGATFRSTDTGYYQGGSQNNGKILPLTEKTNETQPGGYTLNSDGTVTINRDGVFLMTADVQQEAGDSNSFAVQVYDKYGTLTSNNQYNTFATEGVGFQRGTITTVMPLKSGDKVSVALISPGPITLRRNPNGTSTSTSTVGLSIAQVAEPPKY